MSDLKEQFEAAAERITQLPERPDDDTLLRIYALYKQATSGDVEGERPGFADFVGTAKYDAREALEGTSCEEAMRRYIDLVESLDD